MEKIIDGVLGVIEALIVAGVMSCGIIRGFQVVSKATQKEAIEVLRKPQPSLEKFTKKLTRKS